MCNAPRAGAFFAFVWALVCSACCAMPSQQRVNIVCLDSCSSRQQLQRQYHDMAYIVNRFAAIMALMHCAVLPAGFFTVGLCDQQPCRRILVHVDNPSVYDDTSLDRAGLRSHVSVQRPPCSAASAVRQRLIGFDGLGHGPHPVLGTAGAHPNFIIISVPDCSFT